MVRFLTAVLLLTFGLHHTSAEAQIYTGSHALWGEVRDGETGESLPHASVQIEGTRVGTTTNADGRFALVDFEPDSLTLRFSHIGYRATEVEALPTDPPERLLIELQPAAIQLDEVDAVAESYRFVQQAEHTSRVTLSPRDVAFLPNVGETDIFRSLQLLPGINSTMESSSGLYVRGGTPDQNLILFDGIPVYHVDHFFGFFSAFNADAIKDVQIHTEEDPEPIVESAETLPRQIRTQPTTEASARIGQVFYLGEHEATVYRVNTEYEELYEYQEQDSRFLNDPPSNVTRGVGIFTAFSGAAEEFAVEVYDP